MADIFISYSSYNREEANALVKELRAAGHDVWMDQGGIGGAMDWSSEIVEALNKAKTVLFLISKDSVTSHNCAKEIHLANEKHKNILPVVLENTPLPVLFEYPLAGLQRVPYERTDAILQALEVLKGGKSVLEAMLTQSKIDDGIVRLAVLPFEDQSPSQDNEWFASGMTDELIDTLGSLSNLKVNPRGDVIYYKKNRPKLKEIVTDLNVRYIVEGTVQKVGEKIRIKVSLTDCKLHQQIWREKYDGTFDDIFDLQDKTCYAISETINLRLTPEDKEKIDKKPTENAEAYELLLKSIEYYHRQGREDYEQAIIIAQEAIKIDPTCSILYGQIANTSQAYYQAYSKEEKWLTLAEESVKKMREIDGDHANVLYQESWIAIARGNASEAYRLATLATHKRPDFDGGFDSLSFACLGLGKLAEAAEAREQVVRLKESNQNAHFNLLAVLERLGEKKKLMAAVQRAIPVYERHLRRSPEDLSAQVQFCHVLMMGDERERAIEKVHELSALTGLNGVGLYNMACLYAKLGLPKDAMSTLQNSFKKGFSVIDAYLHVPDLESIRNMSEYNALIKELEEKIASEQKTID